MAPGRAGESSTGNMTHAHGKSIDSELEVSASTVEVSSNAISLQVGTCTDSSMKTRRKMVCTSCTPHYCEGVLGAVSAKNMPRNGIAAHSRTISCGGG